MTSPVQAALDRAVAAGIVTREQADAIAALDTQIPAPSPARRVAHLPEVLGYVGGALAVVAALLLGQELWKDLGPVVRVLLLAAVTVATLVGGALLHAEEGPTRRLSSFLWAATVVTVAAATGVAAADLLRVDMTPASVAASVAALAVAVVLWWLRRDVLQHVAAFGAAAATLLTLLEWLDAFRHVAPLLWGFGIAWIVASATDRLRPAGTGWVLGSLAVIAGPLAADSGRNAWLVVGVLSTAALVVVGVRTGRPWVVALGTAGLFVTVPVAVATLFETDLGPLVGLLLLGLLLVGLAVLLAHRAARPRPDHRPGPTD